MVDPTAGGHLPPIPTRRQLERAGIRIAVGIPLGYSVSDAAFNYLWGVAQRGWPLIADRHYGRVDVHRNEFAKALLASDYTHLAMLDTDQLHQPDVIEHLARWILLDKQQCQIVSGLHFRRGAPFDPLCFEYDKEADTFRAPVEWPIGLIEADVIGHGSVIIAREVFETLPEPWWAYSYQKTSEGKYPSEDVYFCAKARNAGFRIFVDTTQTSDHLTTAQISEESFRRWLADHPEAMPEIESEQESSAA